MKLFAVVMGMALTLTAFAQKSDTWSVKADYIEACSCSLFCSCYFNTGPEGGMMCEFNNAVKISKGHVGDVKLDGKLFWLSGDLGGDFTKGMKSAVVTFNTGTTQAEKDAIMFLVGKIYPVTWKEVNMDEAPITWKKDGINGYAKLGDKAEVKLEGVVGPNGKQSQVDNIKYWGAQKNGPFMLAYGTHWYKGFGHDYKLEKRNGFFVHIESEGKLEE